MSVFIDDVNYLSVSNNTQGISWNEINVQINDKKLCLLATAAIIQQILIIYKELINKWKRIIYIKQTLI